MLIFELKPRYNQRTGEIDGEFEECAGCFCDYCGKRHKTYEGYDDENEDETGAVEIRIVEYEGFEASFTTIDPIIIEEGSVDIYSLFSRTNPFIYCDEPGSNCSISVCETAVKRHEPLHYTMYRCRRDIVETLLKEKKYTPQALMLDVTKY